MSSHNHRRMTISAYLVLKVARMRAGAFTWIFSFARHLLGFSDWMAKCWFRNCIWKFWVVFFCFVFSSAGLWKMYANYPPGISTDILIDDCWPSGFVGKKKTKRNTTVLSFSLSQMTFFLSSPSSSHSWWKSIKTSCPGCVRTLRLLAFLQVFLVISSCDPVCAHLSIFSQPLRLQKAPLVHVWQR